MSKAVVGPCTYYRRTDGTLLLEVDISISTREGGHLQPVHRRREGLLHTKQIVRRKRGCVVAVAAPSTASPLLLSSMVSRILLPQSAEAMLISASDI